MAPSSASPPSKKPNFRSWCTCTRRPVKLDELANRHAVGGQIGPTKWLDRKPLASIAHLTQDESRCSRIAACMWHIAPVSNPKLASGIAPVEGHAGSGRQCRHRHRWRATTIAWTCSPNPGWRPCCKKGVSGDAAAVPVHHQLLRIPRSMARKHSAGIRDRLAGCRQSSRHDRHRFVRDRNAAGLRSGFATSSMRLVAKT